jgi:hypothetical protein
MALLTAGMGYRTDIDGLHLQAQVQADGWRYRILRTKDNELIKNWTLPPHESTGAYAEPENTKFHAVSDALLELGKTTDDPHDIFGKIPRTPYGPGHTKPSPR